MNRLYQKKVNDEARQLEWKKRNKIKDAIHRNKEDNIYRTPEHPDYHDTEVDYRDQIPIKVRQEKFKDELDEAETSPYAGIWFGGRKKRTQKRKLRKTKRKRQNKRKSRKSRK